MWRATAWRIPIALTIAGVTCACAMFGCSSGKGFANENDRLRAQIVDLENEVRALTSRAGELEAQLAQASRAPTSVPQEIIANTPQVASISLGRLSAGHDADGDGRIDSIIAYLEPADGMGRFLQVVGSVSLHAAVIPEKGEAATIGQATIGPRQLREAYRSSFTGQHYALSMPIDLSRAPAGTERCTLRVVFTDGYTGREYTTQREIDLK